MLARGHRALRCEGAGLAPAWRMARLFVRLALLSVCLTAGCSTPTAPDDTSTPAPPASTPSGVAGEIVELTNVERERQGLAALRSNARLMEAAQIHADQMARLQRLDHVLPDATYPRPEDRLAQAGYRWQAWAENLASGQRSAAEAVSGWMQSPGHRANILHTSVTEIGTAVARDA